MAAKLLLLIALAAPLISHPEVGASTVVLPAITFRWAVALATLVFLGTLVTRREWDIDVRDPVLWALLAYVVVSLLSAAWGGAPWRSFYGEFRRMGGVTFWIYLTLYYFACRHCLGSRGWRCFCWTAVGVGVAAAVWGIAQWLGIIAYPYETPPLLASGPIPNPGIFVGYLMVTIFIAVWLIASASRRGERILAAAALAILAAAHPLTGNRSSLAAMAAAGAIIGFGVFRRSPLRRGRTLLTVGAGLVVVAVLGWIVRLSSDIEIPLIERLASTDLTETNIRLRALYAAAAVRGFIEAPILGAGVENFLLVFTRHHQYPEFQALPSPYEDRAHNQILELLSTQGLIGLIAYAAIWVTCGTQLLQAYRRGAMSRRTFEIIAALGVAYAIYLQFWFHDLATGILLVGVAAYIRSVNAPAKGEVQQIAPRLRVLVGLAALTIVFFTYQRTVPVLRAAALSERAVGSGELASAFRGYSEAIDVGAPEMAELASLYARGVLLLSTRLDEIRADSTARANADAAVVKAEVELSRLIQMDRHFDLWYLDRGDLYAFATLLRGDPRYVDFALEDYAAAAERSPSRLAPIQKAAVAQMIVGRTDAALALLNRADRLHHGVPQTSVVRARVALTAGDLDLARRSLAAAWAREYWGGSAELDELVSKLLASRREREAASTLQDYFDARMREEAAELTGADQARLEKLSELWIRAGVQDRADSARLLLERWAPDTSSVRRGSGDEPSANDLPLDR